MAEIVPYKVGNPGGAERGLPRFWAESDWLADLVAENVAFRRLGLTGRVQSQKVQDGLETGRRDRNPPRLARLRGRTSQAQPAWTCIHVSPSQRQHFASAEPCVERRHDQGSQLHWRDFEQLALLIRRQTLVSTVIFQFLPHQRGVPSPEGRAHRPRPGRFRYDPRATTSRCPMFDFTGHAANDIHSPS